MGQLVAVVKVSEEFDKETQQNSQLRTRRIFSETAHANRQTGFFEVFLTYNNPADPRVQPCTVKAELGAREENNK